MCNTFIKVQKANSTFSTLTAINRTCTLKHFPRMELTSVSLSDASHLAMMWPPLRKHRAWQECLSASSLPTSQNPFCAYMGSSFWSTLWCQTRHILAVVQVAEAKARGEANLPASWIQLEVTCLKHCYYHLMISWALILNKMPERCILCCVTFIFGSWILNAFNLFLYYSNVICVSELFFHEVGKK